jgi:transposase-like protein
VSELVGAERYERHEERVGYRNGYRARQLYTRVGPVTLQVPQTRDGSFSTDIFQRYQRSEQAFEDAMVVIVLPEKYRKRLLRTTNMQERLNEEIRRRERLIHIFPNDESALRMFGALLAEQNEVWQARSYLDMDEFNEWLMEYNGSDEPNIVEMKLLTRKSKGTNQ